MQFYENLCKICARLGTSPSAVVTALGLSTGSPTAWKNGVEPRKGTIYRIADHLGVAAEELTGEKEKPAPIFEDGPMPPKEYETLTPEQRQIVDALIQSLASQNQE